MQEIEHYSIPPSFYMDSCHILRAIKQELDAAVTHYTSGILKTRPVFKYKAGGEQAVLSLPKGVVFYVDNGEPQPLHMSGFCVQSAFNEININVFAFPNIVNPGFLYSSIVEIL